MDQPYQLFNNHYLVLIFMINQKQEENLKDIDKIFYVINSFLNPLLIKFSINNENNSVNFNIIYGLKNL